VGQPEESPVNETEPADEVFVKMKGGETVRGGMDRKEDGRHGLTLEYHGQKDAVPFGVSPLQEERLCGSYRRVQSGDQRGSRGRARDNDDGCFASLHRHDKARLR
jgi:hypothetical protein